MPQSIVKNSWFLLCAILALVTVLPVLAGAEVEGGAPHESVVGPCEEVIAKLARDHERIMTEIGRLRRDNAMLRQSLEKPGIKEALGGIGYILGLLGTAFFFAAKAKEKNKIE